jgi:uncharacterized protein
MRYSEGTIGRVFILRLDNGDKVPTCIERFAEEKGLSHGQVIMIGGIDKGQVVTGPRFSDVMPPDPLLIPVDGAREVVGVGLIAPDSNGQPSLHMHASLGRSGQTLTGCLRPGVETWLVGEVVIIEICGARAARIHDPASGFALLEPQ